MPAPLPRVPHPTDHGHQFLWHCLKNPRLQCSPLVNIHVSVVMTRFSSLPPVPPLLSSFHAQHTVVPPIVSGLHTALTAGYLDTSKDNTSRVDDNGNLPSAIKRSASRTSDELLAFDDVRDDIRQPPPLVIAKGGLTDGHLLGASNKNAGSLVTMAAGGNAGGLGRMLNNLFRSNRGITPLGYRRGRGSIQNWRHGQYEHAKNDVEHAATAITEPEKKPADAERKKRVLILMSDTGGGHRASAEAIKSTFELEYGDKYEVTIIDLWKEHTPWPFNQMPKSYSFLVRHETLWKVAFYATKPKFVHQPQMAATSAFVAREVSKGLDKYKPDVIVSVHPLMQHIPLRVLRSRGLLHRIPFTTVVTDLTTCHPTWFHRLVTVCFCPTKDVAQRALKAGLQPPQIRVHGLPIRPAFAKPSAPKDELRRALGMDLNLPAALLIGGGEGMGPVEATAKALAATLAPAGGGEAVAKGQLVVICGRNKKLLAKLQAVKWPLPVLLKGFVTNMPDVMAACDCIITKAGPGTIAESMIRGLPMVLNDFIAGQEAGNVPYVVDNGTGVFEENPKEIGNIVADWFGPKSDQFKQMAANALRIARPDAVTCSRLMAGSTWKYNIGLLLILLVVFIWVTSAEVTQLIFEKYRHPFLLTWLGAALLVIYLPIAYLRECITPLISKPSSVVPVSLSKSHKDLKSHSSGGELQRLKNESRHHKRPSKPPREIDDSTVDEESDLDTELLLQKSLSDIAQPVRSAKLSTREIIKCALVLAPLWLLTEYLSNAALSMTSVASTTILSSTSGLFTLLFGVTLGNEKLTTAKVVAVLVSIAGVVMTELGKSTAADDSEVFGDDARNPGEGAGQYVLPSQHLVGDIFGLLSAVSYGVYTTLLRKYVGDDEAGDEKADMQKVFGYIGLVTLLGLWWIVFPLHVLGLEPLAVMPSTVNLDEDIVANSLVGSVVSDYCWALSVVWTTPLVATLGLSLTIPLAMVADMVMHGRQYSIVYILGSVQVFGGFLIANMADKCMGGPATDHESPRFEKEMIDILRSPVD
ncbi:unnamed protein product [Closterium sp. Yama58-4]|nr:unnamed protein product [Closterium sp. Yama58-4]